MPAVAKTSAPHFFVDAGIYAQAANAQQAIDTLKAAQLPVVSEELQMLRGPRTRVRVGPFAIRAQAMDVASRVQALGLPALVDGQAAPAPKTSNPQ